MRHAAPLFEPASSTGKDCYFENSELFRITEHYSLAAEPRADGDKWTWLDSPSTAEETEAGSCPGEWTRPRAGRSPEGRFTEWADMPYAGNYAPRELSPGIWAGRPALLRFRWPTQPSTRSISPWQQGKRTLKCDFKLSTGIKIKQPNTAECIKYHVPEKVVTKRLHPSQPSSLFPSGLLNAVYRKCHTRDSFTAERLFP